MKTSDLYGQVTADIIAQLEAGTPPWVKAWDAGSFFPENAISKRPYSGVNVLILLMRAQRLGYPSNHWLTFKQALAAKACVRKGEKATPIVFVKRMVPGEDEPEKKAGSMLRVFHVFNEAQIDGLPEPPPATTRTLGEANVAAEALLTATGAKVRFGPTDPCFIPSEDVILMPAREAFHGDEHYYATSLHEHVHWSGAKHRLDRDLTGRFGTQSYAAEELVAELGAAFLCAHLGIQGELRHAGYIGNWMRLLKSDDRAIFTAAAKASEASNYLRAFSEQSKEELEEPP